MSEAITNQKTSIRYLIQLSLVVLILLGSVVCVNVHFDPFFFFRAPSISQDIHHNPLFRQQIRTLKANQIRHTRPCGIILGTSRTEYGLDPAHSAWGCDSVYSIAVPSSNIYEVYRLFQHVEHIYPQTPALLALDFFMFNLTTNSDSADFIESNLAVDVDGNAQSMWSADFFKKITSQDVLFWSLNTALHPESDQPYRRNGYRDPSYKERDFYAGSGHRVAFQESEASFYKTFADFKFKNEERDNLQIYRQLIELAYRKGIELRLIISPVHVRQIEVIATAGVYDLWEEWKRQMLSINLDVAQSMGKEPYTLWDFSGYYPYTQEGIPLAGDDKTRMTWFWESSHYKKGLGDIVLSHVLSHQDSEQTIDKDFGVVLTPDNIVEHLNELHKGRLQWREEHPQDVSEIQALIEDL